jgi:hypothetical protein
MLNGLRSRLTYANVMATVAVFLAFGGGAYALSGIPDGSGIYHGCVASSGALRVVTKASSCLKAKTVKRGSRRVRVPGESAIAWNQQGPTGQSGAAGQPGQPGQQGQQGNAGSDASSILTGRLEKLTDYGTFGTGTNYAYPQGDTPGTGFSTEGDATELSPARTVVARDLFVKENAVSPNALGTRNYILRVNGSASTLRCSTTAGSSNPSGTIQCSDTTDAVTIPPGSTIDLNADQSGYYTGGGVATTIPVRFGFRVASS